MKKNLKRFAVLLACLALVSAAAEDPEPEPAAQPIPVQVAELNSGAERGPGFTSVHAGFPTSSGIYTLTMWGLKEPQKTPVLAALSEHYDPAGGTPLKLVDDAFADAEKYDHMQERDFDSGLCWAASLSNMLWITGWAEGYTNPRTGLPFSSEDDLFNYLCSRFTNDGVDFISNPLDWFFMGEFYNMTYYNAADLRHPENNPEDGLRKDFVSSFLTEIYDMILDPQQIGVLERCDWSGPDGGANEGTVGSLLMGELCKSEHSVTVSGIITDPLASDWTEKYLAILLTDSDNDTLPDPEDPEDFPEVPIPEMEASRAARPNSVTVYPLEYATDINGTPYWKIIGYGTDPEQVWALFSVTRLPLFDPSWYSLYRETEGSASVATDDDLTLEGLFTTDREEELADMYMVEEKDVAVSVFSAGKPVNLNFFIANRGHFDLTETDGRRKEIPVTWSVTRDADGSAVAGGIHLCSADMIHGYERGFMIHLNEKDGILQSWEPGAYTVTLDLNADRSVPEAYFLNNVRKEAHFEIR